MKHKHAVNQKEHKHAELLRIAADNADQLFECDEYAYEMNIAYVLSHDKWNWRPVKQTKKIKRWLWANKDGHITARLYTKYEIENRHLNALNTHTVKLLWSETEFEVDDENTLTPLYTKSTQPLSDDEICKLEESSYVLQTGVNDYEFDFIYFARAIEKAHNIGE
jgi:hypothetical protein